MQVKEKKTKLTALQKNVAYALPTSARLAKTNPNSPCVAKRAMFSTSVTALRASARCDSVHISVMTPLAAGAEPEPKGSKKAATAVRCCVMILRRAKAWILEHTEIDVPSLSSKRSNRSQCPVHDETPPQKY
jgi:hypothetical protein